MNTSNVLPILLSLGVLVLAPEPVAAQYSCTLVANSGPTWAWPMNFGVTVNIDPTFTSQQQQAIRNSFGYWSASQAGVDARISFSFTYNAAPTVGPGMPNPGNYQVYNGVPPDNPAAGGETNRVTITGTLVDAYTYMNPGITNLSAFSQTMAHEIGHTFGLDDCPGTCQSVMTGLCPGGLNDASCGYSAPTPCDSYEAVQAGAYTDGSCSGPTPNCNGTTFCLGGSYHCTSCDGPAPDPCYTGASVSCGSNGQWQCIGSPIIIDTVGEGFHLTSLNGGVRFRLNSNMDDVQMSWTQANCNNAFLFLDRNQNGKVDNATELFGSFTPQPKSSTPNGYAALAVFDDPRNGGNGNGKIDPGDAIFDHLQLWIDRNHDGISQPDELLTLRQAGIFTISLDYQLIIQTDQYGNIFRYRSSIADKEGHEAPFCYDVLLLLQPPPGWGK